MQPWHKEAGMRKAVLLLGMLAWALAATAARAETLVQTDFTALSADAITATWALNGVASVTEVAGATPPRRLELSHGDYSETASAWTQATFRTNSFTAQFDVEFRRQTEGNLTPADGLTFVFADVPATFIGGAGGALGLYGGDDPIAAGKVFGLDINTYAGEGVGFAVSGERPAIEDRPGWTTLPAEVKLVDGGIWRFTLRVTPSGANSHAEVFIEGGKDKLKQVKIADYTSDKPVLPASGRFGFTAGTGGGSEFTDVLNVTVVSPAL
jgi:Bacterial lectin